MAEHREWRTVHGIWHWTEHFPQATQFNMACGEYHPYNLFYLRSKEMPTTGNICQKCKQAYKQELTPVENESLV